MLYFDLQIDNLFGMLDYLHASKFDKAYFAGLCKALAVGRSATIILLLLLKFYSSLVPIQNGKTLTDLNLRVIYIDFLAQVCYMNCGRTILISTITYWWWSFSSFWTCREWTFQCSKSIMWRPLSHWIASFTVDTRFFYIMGKWGRGEGWRVSCWHSGCQWHLPINFWILTWLQRFSWGAPISFLTKIDHCQIDLPRLPIASNLGKRRGSSRNTHTLLARLARHARKWASRNERVLAVNLPIGYYFNKGFYKHLRDHHLANERKR